MTTNKFYKPSLESLESLHLAATVLHHEMVCYNAQIEYIADEIKKNGDFPFKIEEIVNPVIHKMATDKGLTAGFPEWIIKANLSEISLLEQQINTAALKN